MFLLLSNYNCIICSLEFYLIKCTTVIKIITVYKLTRLIIKLLVSTIKKIVKNI